MIAEAVDTAATVGWAIVAWICVGAAVATGLCVGLVVGVWAVGRAGVRAWRGLCARLRPEHPAEAPRLLPAPEKPAGARWTPPPDEASGNAKPHKAA
ncbi:hypothetical protein [Streptomyces aureus]|uniref:hypothetical protein n=1 Tax=Streptomyces aureus TaxID=193461 RepID=UPI00367EF0B4